MAEPAGVNDPREADLEDGRMPFLEHLRELQKRMRNAAIFFLIGVVGSWAFAGDIYDWLRVPLEHAWKKYPKTLPQDMHMAFGSIVEPFWVDMSVALWAGIFVSSPFIFFQRWKFIAPGLYKRERNVGVVFAIVSAACFISGALFCYYLVIEQLSAYLLGYADATKEPTLFLGDYFDLIKNMMLAFGAVFELPVLIYFLAKIGLVTHRGLWKFNRWWVVLSFVIGAVLTPTPDVVSQTMMAVPMIVLYNLSILVAWVVVRNRERANAA
jgi:sec-independent protein translocase protein TatC